MNSGQTPIELVHQVEGECVDHVGAHMEHEQSMGLGLGLESCCWGSHCNTMMYVLCFHM